ncbi:MAG: hypothetical protein DWI48_00545 [Chloroflexi bacterium]|nr:MAG: hypothetical protein DWI48_00545 [Chloroflexota bacterium]
MYYQPPRVLGLIVGTVLSLWAGGVAFLLFSAGSGTHNVALAFASYAAAVAATALAVLFVFWTYSLATMSYALDRNGLVIAWGPIRQVVPLHSIERLVPGSAVGVPRVHGVSWWGHHVGSAEVERIGDVLFYSTHQTADHVLYVMTSERNYAISVEDPSAFAQEVQVRQDLGATAPVGHRVERSGRLLQTLIADRVATVLVAAAIIGLAIVWIHVAIRYGSLPQALTLNWPPSTQSNVVTVTGRDAILELPRAATILLVVNLILGVVLHAWDRMAGTLLLAAAVAVQVALFAATVLALA